MIYPLPPQQGEGDKYKCRIAGKMTKKAILVLEDGSIYEGNSVGATASTYGEVVFNTSMVGYQEILTDPSYAGQIVVPTYPLIGNYGINKQDNESKKIQVRGFIIREECLEPSHYLSNSTLHEFLLASGIPAISGLDTRSISRKLRLAGVMMGIITSDETSDEALARLKKLPDYGSIDFVREVSTETPYEWEPGKNKSAQYHVVCLDCGLKYNILRILCQMGCRVTVVPCTFSTEQILHLKPDGILLSPGPGNPELLGYIIKTVQELATKKPVMGICLGSQLIAQAFGARTFKLKFGHRGANHPVKDLSTGKVYITAQNHGYAVDAATMKNGLIVTHTNLNDNTVEGLRHKDLPIFAIQYHSEASPGPWDSVYLFEQFIQMMKEVAS